MVFKQLVNPIWKYCWLTHKVTKKSKKIDELFKNRFTKVNKEDQLAVADHLLH